MWVADGRTDVNVSIPSKNALRQDHHESNDLPTYLLKTKLELVFPNKIDEVISLCCCPLVYEICVCLSHSQLYVASIIRVCKIRLCHWARIRPAYKFISHSRPLSSRTTPLSRTIADTERPRAGWREYVRDSRDMWIIQSESEHSQPIAVFLHTYAKPSSWSLQTPQITSVRSTRSAATHKATTNRAPQYLIQTTFCLGNKTCTIHKLNNAQRQLKTRGTV